MELNAEQTRVFQKLTRTNNPRFYGMRWIEICWMEEEENERNIQQAQAVRMKKIDAIRKKMLLEKKYELEEGEEFE